MTVAKLNILMNKFAQMQKMMKKFGKTQKMVAARAERCQGMKR